MQRTSSSLRPLRSFILFVSVLSNVLCKADMDIMSQEKKLTTQGREIKEHLERDTQLLPNTTSLNSPNPEHPSAKSSSEFKISDGKAESSMPLHQSGLVNTSFTGEVKDKVIPDKEKLTILDSVLVKVLIGERDALSVATIHKNNTRQPIVLNATGINVYSMDYHCNKSLIFFTANDSIYRASLVGSVTISNPKVIVDVAVDGPVRLAVDWVNDKIYWMCDKYQTVERADLDGGNRRLLFDNLRTFRYPNNIAVDPYAGVLFVTSDYTVFKYNLDGSDLKQVILEGNERGKMEAGVRCLALDRDNRKLFYTGKMYNGNVYLSVSDYDGSHLKEFNLNVSEWNDIYSMEVFKHTLFFAHYQFEDNKGYPDTLWSVDISSDKFISAPQKRFVPKHGRSGIWGIKVFHPCTQRPADDASCSRSPQ